MASSRRSQNSVPIKIIISQLPDVGQKGVSEPATGVDRPSSVASAGTPDASDKEKGSSSSIVSMFSFFAFDCGWSLLRSPTVFFFGHAVRP